MKKNHLLLPLLLLSSSIACAQTVSESDALSKAQKVFTSRNKALGINGTSTPSLDMAYKASSGDETYYYVFNNSVGGFVIVGGDEVAQDILGYSYSGNFDIQEIPDNMKWWLSQYEGQIGEAIKMVKSGETTTSKMKKAMAKAPAGATTIDPLLTINNTEIQWNQYEPYNLVVQAQKGTGFVTGCVPTAGAQVMRYHSWPESYNWSLMLPQYKSGSYTTEQGNAVANLMYNIGTSINATYGTSTSASVRDLGQSMIENFNYDKTLTYKSRSNYSDAQWEQIVYSELKENRPVIYGGQNLYSNSGHAFVCDGYDASNGKFHINWGWGGYCDGYFILTSTGSTVALQPHGSGAGGAGDNASYSRNQDILTGIQRNIGSPYATVMSCPEYSLAESVVNQGKDVKITGRFSNQSYTTFTGQLGIIFVDENGSGTVIPVMNADLPPFYSYSTFTASTRTLNAGEQYRVYPGYSDENGWHQFELKGDIEIPVVTIAEADKEIYAFIKKFTISTTEIAIGKSISLGSVQYGNNGDWESNITFGFKFTNINDDTDVAYTTSYTANNVLPSYTYTTTGFSLSVPASLNVGETYKVTSVYKNSAGIWTETYKKESFDDPTITVLQAENLTLKEAPKVKNNGYFTENDLDIKFTLENKTGNDVNTDIIVWFFPKEGGSSVGYAYYPNEQIKNNQAKGYTINYSKVTNNNMVIGRDYYCRVQDYSKSIYISERTDIHYSESLPISANVSSVGWATLCLPYEAELQGDMRAFTIKNVENDELVLEEAEKIEMNKPYLITATEGTYNFYGPATPTGTYDNGLLTGVTMTDETFAPKDSYVLQNKTKTGLGFYLVAEDNKQKVRPYSAYLTSPVNYTSPNPSGAAFFAIGADVTGIEEVESNEKNVNDVIYNLQGQRVKPGTKGIVIKNGKKYFIK